MPEKFEGGVPGRHEVAEVANLGLSHAGEQPPEVNGLKDMLRLLGPGCVDFSPATVTIGEHKHAVYGNKMPERSETGVNPLDYATELAVHAERYRDFLEACDQPDGAFECSSNRVVDILFEYWAERALAKPGIEINFGGVIKDPAKGGGNDHIRQGNLTLANLLRVANEVLRMAKEAEGRNRPKASVEQSSDGSILLTWQGTWTKGRNITVTLVPPADEKSQWNSKFDWETGTGRPSTFLNVRSLGARIVSTRNDDPRAEGYYNFTDITEFTKVTS